MCVTGVGVGRLNLVLQARVKPRREGIGTMNHPLTRPPATLSPSEGRGKGWGDWVHGKPRRTKPHHCPGSRIHSFFPQSNFRSVSDSRFTWPVIDSAEKLAGLLPRVQTADWVALDTEADSLHAYPEKLCLIQISLPGVNDLVDPLAALDLSRLIVALRGHELILHGADYDLRLLRRTCGFVPGHIFDTMLAARLLGFAQFSLTSLVNRLLGIPLEKGPQTADWARRPLTERMVAYALNDVRYLKPVADSLRAGLEAKGRLDWHREMCARLVDDCAQLRSPDLDQVWRLKDAAKLDRR